MICLAHWVKQYHLAMIKCYLKYIYFFSLSVALSLATLCPALVITVYIYIHNMHIYYTCIYICAAYTSTSLSPAEGGKFGMSA